MILKVGKNEKIMGSYLVFSKHFHYVYKKKRIYLILMTYENQNKFDNNWAGGYRSDSSRDRIRFQSPVRKTYRKKTPSTLYCDIKDNNTLISVKKGNQVNLTLQDYGDGGYSWRFVALDEQFLKKESEQLSWGSTGMLGDFGKDTWIFTALNTGSTTLKLECVRLFDTTDIAQTFVVTVNIQ